MAIWDDISKAATDTTNKAIQQAKNYSEVTKLNGLISEEYKKISDACQAIGKKYVIVHRDDCEEDFREQVDIVTAAEQKIEEYQAQIQRIRGIRNCTKCNAEIPEGYAFCTQCGEPAPKPQVPANTCAKCGATLEENARFCTKCGAVRPEKAAPARKVCSRCGTELESGMMFCTKCGTKNA